MICRRLFIIHGWDSHPQKDWFPWAKREFEKKEFQVVVPRMPRSSEPEINVWVAHLKKVVGSLDKNTYFIGHSIGCQAIMRFLEKEKYAGKIGKVIFVAGWFKLENLEDNGAEAIAHPWITTPLDFKKVKQKLGHLTVFLSTTEPYGFVDYNACRFRKDLGAKIIIEKDKGHFEGVEQLPEILKEL